MVRLGFVKDGLILPPQYRRVYVKSMPGQEEFTTLAWSSPNVDGKQVFELCCQVPTEMEKVEIWAPQMARTLHNMGWTHWWLDTHSIARALNRYIVEAMKRWGLNFWGHYSLEGIVLVQLGIERSEITKGVALWEHHFPHVRVDRAYDYDKQEAELQNNPKKSGGVLGSLFKSKR